MKFLNGKNYLLIIKNVSFKMFYKIESFIVNKNKTPRTSEMKVMFIYIPLNYFVVTKHFFHYFCFYFFN